MEWLAITGLIVCGILSLIYLICADKVSPAWAIIIRFFATESFVIFGLLSYFLLENKFAPAFIFIVLGLIFAIIADMAIEEKDREDIGDFMLKSSAALCVMFKVANIVALYFLILKEFNWLIILYCAIISLVATAIIMIVLKYVVKLYFRKQFINVIIYFIIASFMTAVAIWYATIMPLLWGYAVFATLIYLNDLLLINVNFGVKKFKMIVYSSQRFCYYLSLMFLLYFMWYQFPLI